MFHADDQTKNGIPRVFLCLLALLISTPALAQDAVRNYRKPILMVETGGHHAGSAASSGRDEQTLLSAGEDKVVKVWDLRTARAWRGRYGRRSGGAWRGPSIPWPRAGPTTMTSRFLPWPAMESRTGGAI